MTIATRVLAQAGPSRVHGAFSTRGYSTSILSPIHPRTHTQPYSQNPIRICFSTSSSCPQDAEPHLSGKDQVRGETHYDTLGVPPGASRMEIKAAYFKLSKRYHPDVRQNRVLKSEDEEEAGRVKGRRDKEEERATERFHEVNNAYRVLSDDRQRRAYDRTLSHPSSPHTHPHRTRSHAHGHGHTPGSSTYYASTYEMYRGRKRGATHAWEGPRGYTAGTGYAHAGPHTSTSSTDAGRHYDPTYSPFSTQFQSQSQSSQTAFSSTASTTPGSRRASADRLTGRALRAEEERAEHDRIVRESSVARFFQALGIVLVVSWVGALAGGRGG